MKVALTHALGHVGPLTLTDMPDLVPGAGEPLIDVAYAGYNWADAQVRMAFTASP